MKFPLPFDGFYESHASDLIDNEVDMMLEWDEDPDNEHAQGINADAIEYRPFYEKFSAIYAERMMNMINKEIKGDKITFTFDRLESPRGYNFSTDEIWVEIDTADIGKIGVYDLVDHDRLCRMAKERFTSRSGFHSFVEHDTSKWPCVEDLNPYQVQAIFASMDVLQEDDYPLTRIIMEDNMDGVVEE